MLYREPCLKSPRCPGFCLLARVAVPVRAEGSTRGRILQGVVWDGALEVKGQLAQGCRWVENLVGLDESFLTGLEI